MRYRCRSHYSVVRISHAPEFRQHNLSLVERITNKTTFLKNKKHIFRGKQDVVLLLLPLVLLLPRGEPHRRVPQRPMGAEGQEGGRNGKKHTNSLEKTYVGPV